MNSYQNTIQRRIGLLWGALALAAAGLNVAPLLGQWELFTLGNDNVRTAISLFGFALVGLATAWIGKPFMRAFQVAMFAIAGGIAIWSNPARDPTGIAFVVISVLLAIQYSFLMRFFYLKIAGAAVATVVLVLLSTAFRGKPDWQAAIGALVFVLFGFSAVWVIFSEQIREYVRQTTALVKERDEQALYAKFGRNVAGLVHNMRNLINPLVLFGRLIEAEIPTEEGKELLRKQQRGFQRLQDMVENLLTAVRARHDTVVRPIDVNELVNAVVEWFGQDPAIKRRVNFELKLWANGVFTRAQPAELYQIIENLVRNSCESIDGDRPTGGVVTIETFPKPVAGMRISDNGSGIKGLRSCRDDKCLEFFRVGKTTKAAGLGLGMPFVLEAIRSNGWRIEMESEADKGTTARILFGQSATAAALAAGSARSPIRSTTEPREREGGSPGA